MRWAKNDIEKYISEKEYIDTAIIPIQSFQLSDEKKQIDDTFSTEVLSIYANEIEKELSGRVLLTPTYTYYKFTNLENEVERINEWVADIKKQPFNHVFLLSLDLNIKKQEKNIDADLLWFPGIKPTDLQAKESVQMIRNQIEQMSDLIRSYW